MKKQSAKEWEYFTSGSESGNHFNVPVLFCVYEAKKLLRKSHFQEGRDFRENLKTDNVKFYSLH
jgi:hypothetical protein